MQRLVIVVSASLFCLSSKSVVEERCFAEAEFEKRGIEFRWLKYWLFRSGWWIENPRKAANQPF
jgi:hypothetical protein